jgi:all-beta uncharacterized protein
MEAALLASPRQLWPLLIVLLLAGCGGSASTNVSGPTPTRCAVSVSNSAPEISAAGGTGAVALITARECTWSASSRDSWITLSTTSGQGEATINYSVERNPNGTRRQGHVAVSDQTVEVSQAAAPCQYTVSPSSIDASSAQGELSVALTATPGCSWNAHSSLDWIGSPIPNSGVGSATVRIVIATNTSQARSGTVTLGDATLRVNQASAETPVPGPAPAPPSPSPTPAPAPPAPTPPPTPTPSPCTFVISPTGVSIDATGGQRSITVSSAQNCPWKATTTVNWIGVTSGSEGTGDGMVTVSVGPNSGPARTATVTIASQTLSIEQAASLPPPCTYAIKPTHYDAGRGPETIAIDVAAGAGCAWSTRADATWVTLDPSSGSGNGIVQLVLQANDGPDRSTTVTIAGQPFALHQEGSCSYKIKPNNYHAHRGGDTLDVEVTTDPGCPWTASSSVSWVTVAAGASGTGKGTVRLVIQANDGPPRSVVLTIAGQPFQLRQDGR